MKNMMNNKSRKVLGLVTFMSLGIVFSCSDNFLDVPAMGSAQESVLTGNPGPGIEQTLIGAYSALKGGNGGTWGGTMTGWVYGDVAGEAAYKGSNSGDQSDINPLTTFTAPSTNAYLAQKWTAVYDGINRCNLVLKLLKKVPAGSIDEANTNRITGEALFLRALYHFEAKKMWRDVPFVDESVDYLLNNFYVPNDADIYPKIVTDLTTAITLLPDTQGQVGRANVWAAKALLGKVYLYSKQFDLAFTTLKDVIDNGKTAGGSKYALNAKYYDAFHATTDNSAESVFAIQASIKDGSNGANSNYDLNLNFPYNVSPFCCGFYQPSMDAANAYRTSSGLPLLDGSYNDPGNQLADVAWTTGATTVSEDMGEVDPRLDWVVGRTGVPFFDWGKYPGPAWVRQLSDAGPYGGKKLVFPKSELGVTNEDEGWGDQGRAVNYNLIRFADVLLMGAEAAVEKAIPDFVQATAWVNLVRARAANPAGFVKVSLTGGKTDWDAYLDSNVASNPAGNYVINTYTTTFPDLLTAREAIHMERYLELGMEGHRFFDLVRWGEVTTPAGNQNDTGNPVNLESAYRYNASKAGGTILGSGFPFVKGRSEYYPIPQAQIDQSHGTLKQNF
jgi:hypothetical protein